MLRKSGIGIMLALLVPSLASALGMGEYELSSYLNQPLKMTVDLRDLGDYEADEVIVSIAPQRDYDRSGVERSFFHNNLNFTVESHGDGTGTLHIRSSQPVREPYLSFLVEVLWPAGRLLREFTVLIDPPAQGEEIEPVTQAETAAPATSQPEPEPAEPPARERAAVTESRPAAAEAEIGPREEYRVRNSDTMWTIALNHRPDTSVSVQQMMRAIQNLNPDAFIDGNVNLVREGAVLRIPAAGEVRRIATRQALADVAEQNREWREMLRARGIAVPSRPQMDGRAASADGDTVGRPQAEGRVRLVTPESAESGDRVRGTGTAGGGEDASALENELTIAQENLESLRRENRELSSRLDDLEDQLGTGEELLNLRNDQIARLQAELRRLQEERGVDVADSELLEPVETPAPVTGDATQEPGIGESAAQAGDATEMDQGPAETETAESAESAESAEPVAAQPEPVTSAVAPQPVRQPGPMDILMDNLALVAAGLGVVVLGLGGLLYMRQRRQAEQEGAEFDTGTESGFDDLSDDDFLGGFGEESDHGAAAPEDDGLEDESAAAAADQGEDPLEQVEVFMAYGQYPQAVNHLRDAIGRAPDRQDLKLRLLEVLAEMNDSAAFEEEAGSLAGTDDETDQRIQALRAEMGGEQEPSMDDLEKDLASDLSAPSTASEQDDEGLDDFEFDLGDDQGTPEQPAADSGSGDEEVLDDLGDFELDLDEPQEAGEEDSAAGGDEEFSLDLEGGDDEELSLDLDDGDEGDEAPSLELDKDDAGDDEFSFSLDDEEDSEEPATELSLEDDQDDDADNDADKTVRAPSLDLEDLGEVGTDNGEEALDLDDVSLDDVSDEFADATDDSDESGGGPEEELDLSLDDLSLEGHEARTSTDTPALDVDSGATETLDSPPASDDADRTLVTEAPSFDDEPEAGAGAEQSAEAAFSDDEDFDFLGDTDENATKLDLAKAYIDMGDNEGARDILSEVLSEGNDEQQAEAKELLAQVG